MMNNASDLAHGDISGRLITAAEKRLSDYAGQSIISHWHSELEIIYAEEGAMRICIGDTDITAEEGCAVLIRPHRMHSSAAIGEDCRYICILADTSVFSAQLTARDEFISRLLNGTDGADFFLIKPEQSVGMKEIAVRAAELDRERPNAYMTELSGLVHVMTARICSAGAAAGDGKHGAEIGFAQPEAAIQREMISYICRSYAGKVTLTDIAAAGRVCRSRCCAIFRKYLKQPPIDFLNSYRLTVSLSMLRGTDDRISDIAAACGFTHQSYYTKMFSRKYGCTPNEARARFRSGTAA